MAKGRVLVVDDDQLVRWAVERTVAGQGLEVDSVALGADALARARDGAYALAFLDIHLPDANGLDLLDPLRRAAPGMRIAILSCDGTDENRRRAFDGGAWQFVEKPFEVAELVRLLRTAFSPRHERREQERRLCRVAVTLCVVDLGDGGTEVDVRPLDATIADVSEGGLRLHTSFPLQPGQWLRAATAADDGPREGVVETGRPARVVWVVPDGGGYTAGLRYEPV